MGVAAGTVKHPQATFDYSFLVVKVDYICHRFRRSNMELLQLICYSCLDVVCHFPLNMLIKDPVLLSERECQYAMHPATHLDFLIYNRISKKPVLAIEVDGYAYHKKGTAQGARDLLKNHIMKLYEIPLLRFKTNGSGERERIIEALDKLVG